MRKRLFAEISFFQTLKVDFMPIQYSTKFVSSFALNSLLYLRSL
jgi:hypothetical protein